MQILNLHFTTKFMKDIRKQEILILFYRIFLVYVFYQIARLLFWWYNKDLIKVDSLSEYLQLSYHGTQFDTTALLYINALFIFLSIIPLTFNTKKSYQKFLFWLYFVTNGIAMLMNFGDFIYFKFSQARLTTTAINVAQHETNLLKVFGVSLVQNPSIVVFYITVMALWIFLYQRLKIKDQAPKNKIIYFTSSDLS